MAGGAPSLYFDKPHGTHFSVKPLAPDDARSFIHAQLNAVGMPESNDYHRDQRTLKRALTWPAAWLEAQALSISAEYYNKLLLRKLGQIRKHGDPGHYRNFFPRYLMKCLQDHCRQLGAGGTCETCRGPHGLTLLSATRPS